MLHTILFVFVVFLVKYKYKDTYLINIEAIHTV